MPLPETAQAVNQPRQESLRLAAAHRLLGVVVAGMNVSGVAADVAPSTWAIQAWTGHKQRA
jgi:hypothetical protein